MQNPSSQMGMNQVVSPPLFLLNSTFEIIYQSGSATDFAGNSNSGLLIGNVLVLQHNDADSSVYSLETMLHEATLAKQQKLVADCLVIPLMIVPPKPQKVTVEIVPVLNEQGVVYQLLLMLHFMHPQTDTGQALEKALQLIASIERASECGSWELDLLTSQLTWSDGVFVLCGYEPREFEVTPQRVLSVIHPEDIDYAAKALSETLETGKEYDVRKRLLTKQGGIKHVISRASVIRNKDGQPLRLMGVFIDRTVEQEYHDNLLLEQTNEVALINSTDDLIWSVDTSFHIISCNTAFSDMIEQTSGIRLSRGDYALNEAYGPEQLAKWKAYYERALSGDRFTVKEESFDAEGELVRCNYISITPFLNHNRKIRGVACFGKDMTAETKKYQSLIETTIENLPIGIAVHRTEDNTVVLMNKNFTDTYGWPKEALTDVSSFFEKVYPDELYRKAIKKRVLDDMQSGNPDRMNWDGITITTQHGEERIINAKNIPMVDQNLMISTVIDVTEREANLEQIKDSERKLLAAQRLVKLGNWQLDLETGAFDWSDEVYNIWGLDKHHTNPNLDTFYASVHPEDRKLFDGEKEDVLAGHKQLDLEHRILLPDGTIKWVHEKATLIKDEFGNNQTLEGSVQDITVEKMLSLSLEESNQRYHYATQATFDAIWDWDIAKNTIYRGENYQFIFGYSEEELVASGDSWADHIHPDDKDAVVNSITQALNGNQSKWSEEYKYEQHDGSYAFVIDRGIIVRDRNGKAVRMVGAMQDITKQKIEESRLKLLESVITNTNDAVLITEAEPMDEPGPKIIYVNAAFTRMTGYTMEEVIGKSPRILQGPESDKEALKKLSHAMRNWQPCEITTVNYKKNGDPFWINFAITPVADASGWYTHWVSVERDVTILKQSEQDLKKAYEDTLRYLQNIEDKNKRLSEIAWIQSHIVRAPLARIMGIVDALNQYDLDALESKQLLDYLNESAIELDKIIREIADKSAETQLQ